MKKENEIRRSTPDFPSLAEEGEPCARMSF